MDILEVLRQDYDRFPKDQSFELYSDEVYFQDPLNRFRGIMRYQKMISFLDRWFSQIDLSLHDLERDGQKIRSEWTLGMTCPLPWRPRLNISGYSLLTLNDEGLICAHVDYWHDAPLKVLTQVFSHGQ